MLFLLQLVMGILLILSMVGYMQFVRRVLAIRWEFIPIFVFSAIACIIYFAGLAGQLFIGSMVVLVAGLLLLRGRVVQALYQSKRGPWFFPFSLFQWSFLGGVFVFLLILFQTSYLIDRDSRCSAYKTELADFAFIHRKPPFFIWTEPRPFIGCILSPVTGVVKLLSQKFRKKVYLG